MVSTVSTSSTTSSTQRLSDHTSTSLSAGLAGGLRIATLAPGASAGVRTPNNNVSYLLSDHLGSTSLTTNSAGTVTSEMRYTAWGETRFTSGTSPSNYRYTGQRQEASFGLYFYREASRAVLWRVDNARWYDNSLGRFAQADTIIPGGVQGLDRYAYGLNNPSRFTDPSGHKSCDGAGINGACDQSGIPGTLGQVRKELRSYGVSLKGNWGFDDAYDAYFAIYSVGIAFSQVTGKNGSDVFRSAFGPLNLYYGDAPGKEGKLNGYYGVTVCGPEACNIALKPDKITSRLIVHELGHAFEKRMWYRDGQVYEGTDNPLQLLRVGIFDTNGNLITASQNRYNGMGAPDNGYYCNSVPCQYHSTGVDDYWNDPSEDYADIFMNWVFDSFYPNGAGNALYNWTETNMKMWLQ